MNIESPHGEARGQSESIGVILMVGVVVISIATVGTFALTNTGEETTDADISVQVTTSGVFVTHASGDAVPMSDLEILVRDGDRTLRPAFTNGLIYDGDGDDIFEPSERWADVNHDFDLNTPITVSLFDTNTNQLLVEETVYPKTAFPAGPTAPIPRFTVGQTPTTATDPLTFNASNSTDEDGTVVSYTWYFGDGTSVNGTNVSHTYASGGSYNVTLRVEDDVGVVNNTTKTLTVLSVRPQVVGVDVSNAPIKQSDTAQTQTITVQFDRPMNTSVHTTVELRNFTGISYGTGTWVSDTTYQQKVDIADADEESTGRVNVSDAEDETGDVVTPNDSKTFVVDTTVPDVSQYTVTNPSGPTVAVNFTVTEQLDEVQVTLTNDQGSQVTEFTEGDFTVTTTGDGNYTYNTTYDVSAKGKYNATLERAQDVVVNDGATGQSKTVKVQTGSGEPVIQNFSDVTASSDRDLVTVGNVTAEQYASGVDLQSVVVEVRKQGNTTELGNTSLTVGSNDRVSQKDVTVDAAIDKGTKYNITIIATSTNGKSASQSENVTGEETLDSGTPTADVSNVVADSSADEARLDLNATDDKSLKNATVAVYEKKSKDGSAQYSLANETTVQLSGTSANKSVIVATQVKKKKQDYKVEVTVYDDHGNASPLIERDATVQ